MIVKWHEFFTVFMVLFAIIDITGSIPIIIDIKQKTGDIDALRTTLFAYILMLLFLFLGEPFLKLFRVDISSFAIAGSFVIFLIALEMILGIQLFKYEYIKGSVPIVPLSFPLIAGAGSLTTIISLKAEYHPFVIFTAITLNMVIVYLVLKMTTFFEKLLGLTGILILKKIFGIILLAIAIRLFLSNTGLYVVSSHNIH